MKSTHRLSVIAAAFVVFVSLARGQEVALEGSVRAEGIANWPAPAYWTPPGRAIGSLGERGEIGVEAAEGVVSSASPLPFIAVTPCRIVDTRGAAGPYGGPALVANATRTFDIPSGPCPGIPALASAYSLNFTIIGGSGVFTNAFLTAWPTGDTQPTVSTLNFNANQLEANAAIVPAGTSGSINVFVNAPGHLLIDINGYYAAAGVGTGNTFLGLNAGNFTMTGDNNTGVGHNALFSNTTGAGNTATGDAALYFNTQGNLNTATGAVALSGNTTGFSNTATGANALYNNTTGNFNTATGDAALFYNITGNSNTAIGVVALSGNTTGFGNTATGTQALYSNTLGHDNTATGGAALNLNTTGSNNIGIGSGAGFNLTTGSNNICIGNSGVAGESSTIRIGTVGIQTATFIAGIYDADATGGTAVFVTPSGKLGTGMVLSSHRFKKEIRDIAEESDGLMRLRPVAFKYTPQIDPKGLAQYGLIAEEVAEVYPDLVAYDRDGQPETVRYHLVNALLLNEVQKQHRTLEAQEKTIEQQQAEIGALQVRLSRLEARLLADSRP